MRESKELALALVVFSYGAPTLRGSHEKEINALN